MQYRISDFLKSVEFKIILIAVFLRLFGVTSPYISDESMLSETVRYMHMGNFDPMVLDPATNTVIPPNIGIPHPPMGILLYFLGTAIFGVIPLGMRLTPLLLGIGVMCMTYFLSKRLYGRKTAILTLALMAFSFYSVWGSLYIDYDGAILSFFVTSAIYSYVRFRDDGENNAFWLRLSAIFLGLALLTKYSALMVIPVILLAELLYAVKERNFGIRKIAASAYPAIGILFVGAIIFSIFPILSFLSGRWGSFLYTFSYGGNTLFTDTVQSQFHTLSAIAMSFAKDMVFILQYATPLIPILVLLSFRNRSGREAILYSWISVFLIFYTLLVPGGGKVRYLMILIPPLYILAARGLLAFPAIGKKTAIYAALLSVAFLGIIFALNTYGSMKTFNTHNLGMQTVIDNGFFWYGGHGSSVFAIHIQSFIFVVALSALLFAASFKKSYFLNALLAILALSIAFNGFILFQSFHPTVGPDYRATLEAIAADYKDTEGPIYGITQFRNALNIYFGGERVGYTGLLLNRDAAGNFNWSMPDMKGSKVIVIDAELMDNPMFIEPVGRFLSKNCTLEKKYYSNNYPFGYVYNC